MDQIDMSQNPFGLSDNNLCLILDNLPLRDLIQMESICKKWQLLHKRVCNEKTDLTLYSVQAYKRDLENVSRFYHLMGKTFGRNYDFFSLRIHNSDTLLSGALCQNLAAKFKNITKLNLIGVEVDFHDLVSILAAWSKCLEHLALVSGERTQISNATEDWDILWPAISSLNSLKHLALPLRADNINSNFMATILPRLESLHILLIDDFKCDCLNQLFEHISANMKRLSLKLIWKDVDYNTTEFTEENFDIESKIIALLDKYPETFQRLTHFAFDFQNGLDFCRDAGIETTLLDSMCNKLDSVTHLDIGFVSDTSLTMILSSLKKLSSLKSLRICCKPDDSCESPESLFAPSDDDEPELPGDPESKEYNRKFENEYPFVKTRGFFSGITPKDASKLCQIESLTSLHLDSIDLYRWEQLIFLAIAFPRLEELHFDRCPVYFNRHSSCPNATRAQLMLGSLGQFQSLRKVYRNKMLLFEMDEPQQHIISVIEFWFEKEIEKYKHGPNMDSSEDDDKEYGGEEDQEADKHE